MDALPAMPILKPTVIDLDDSSYTSALWDLFIHEFLSAQTYNSQREDTASMSSRRRAAAKEAYCQQVAFESLRGRRPNPHLHEASKNTRPCSWICSLEASDIPYPRTVQRGPLIRACSWLDLNPSFSGQYLTQKDEETNRLAGWPEYLWDLRQGHAVRTQDLYDKRPAYTAISHTWGRWRHADSGHSLPEETTPEDLRYPIPLSKIEGFNVENISQDLQNLKDKVNTDYIWLDLVCLPQGIEGTQLTDRSKQLMDIEISRQGWIFRNATFSIAWLHDVKDLSCLEGFFKLSVSMLPHLKLDSKEEAGGAKKSPLSETLSSIGSSTGLLHPLDSPLDTLGLTRTETIVEDPQQSRIIMSSDDTPNRQANVWFTSLWTLQEVCLRPDMWLATSDWNIFSLNKDQPIPLSGFLCVEESPSEPDYSIKSHPNIKAVKDEIRTWTMSTGLTQILELSRIDIIRLGDRRYCEGRRAEAIMSVLGATTWFHPPGDREADLILGKYPLRFVEEVRNLIPGEFFATYAKAPYADPNDFNQVVDVNLLGYDGGSLVTLYSRKFFGFDGSLLPFSHMGHSYVRYDRIRRLQLDVHDSVRSWELATSGRVRITKACILSSSTIGDISKDPGDLPGFFLGFSPGGVEGEEDMTLGHDIERIVENMVRVRDVHEWTKTRNCEIHLVLVMERQFKELVEGDQGATARGELYTEAAEESHVLKGVVLRAADDSGDKVVHNQSASREHKKLLKIGCFEAVGPVRVSLPEVREVDWEVL